MRQEEMEVAPAKWGLTSKGAAALSTGLVALPVLEGVAHLGPLGIVLAGAATLVAFRHGDQIQARGKAILQETVQGPALERSMKDRMLGTKSAPRKAVRQPVTNGSILIGRDRQGKEVRRFLDELQSILILALPGQGKSTAASYILAQIIEQGGRIAIIDRHARSSGSLSAMLSPFEAAFTMQPAYESETMMGTLEYAEGVLEARMKAGDEDGPAFILAIDEITNLLKKLGQKSDWGRVAEKLSDVVESFNEMGRKYNCFTLCIGQLTNASRTGGTEIRELFTTRLIGGMQESQARLVLPKEIAGMASDLERGEFIADFEGKQAPFQVKVPQLSPAYARQIADSIERDPFDELADMEDIDPDDSRYEDEQIEEVIPIGRDNRTKQEVGIPKQTFDMLVRMRKNGKLSGFREIQDLLDCTETHARNINKLIDEACETGREGGRE